MNIVLVEPEIPGNTGSIARTCAATSSKLHLVRPLGFSIEDKYLKRAGLDYWPLVDITYYDSIDEVLEKHSSATFHFLTTKAKHSYADASFGPDDFLVFGKETKGLPEDLIDANQESCFRIPMVDLKEARSLNLSNAACIVLYEALRQNGFEGLR